MLSDLFGDPGMLFFALLAGILPATFWLWFWLKEDKLHPEPRGLIILSFLVGMLATVSALPVEKYIAGLVPHIGFTMIVLWAATEEILKFLGIYIVALRTKYFDEPIDAVVYLMTIALGFAALENALYLFNPLVNNGPLAMLALGNFRFIGATLLHVGASGIVGVALALSFYQSRLKRLLVGLLSLFGAIILHTLFNFSIIESNGHYLYEIFMGLWVFIIAILLVCEKIKRLAPRSHVEYPHTGIVLDIPKRSHKL